MSRVFPKYSVTVGDSFDRLQYTPDRPWPVRRSGVHIRFLDPIVVDFNERSRPSELLNHLTQQARHKIQARRQTPRGDALPANM